MFYSGENCIDCKMWSVYTTMVVSLNWISVSDSITELCHYLQVILKIFLFQYNFSAHCYAKWDEQSQKVMRHNDGWKTLQACIWLEPKTYKCDQPHLQFKPSSHPVITLKWCLIVCIMSVAYSYCLMQTG